MSALKMPPQLVGVLRRLYERNTVVACLGSPESLPVPSCRGLKQGCPLSPLLSVLYVSGLERSLIDSGMGFQFRFLSEGLPHTWVLPGLAFANDLVLLAENIADLQQLVTLSTAHLARLGSPSTPTNPRCYSFLESRKPTQCARRTTVSDMPENQRGAVPAFEVGVQPVRARSRNEEGRTRAWHERGQREVARVAIEPYRATWGGHRLRHDRRLARWLLRVDRQMHDQKWARRVLRYMGFSGCSDYVDFSTAADYSTQWLSHAARGRVREAETEQWRSSKLVDFGALPLALYDNDTGSAREHSVHQLRRKGTSAEHAGQESALHVVTQCVGLAPAHPDTFFPQRPKMAEPRWWP
ncbi:hypothetical protein HPB50_027039 [Hyalomma asiaticum]|uniref:Uncharacterized protein n=1 Tax=Hyalomma asiaticum TaxID=266040 RepID=A0ACB7RR86_HYAAI|nr:hypothetical protein HPB50_027039 [Hyalomma asiaticum]